MGQGKVQTWTNLECFHRKLVQSNASALKVLKSGFGANLGRTAPKEYMLELRHR